METTTSSEKQTQKVAQNLAGSLKGGNVVALYGDLGSGKTVFVKGLAKGLGIKRRITSPTFVFVKSYKLPRAKSPRYCPKSLHERAESSASEFKTPNGFFHHVDLYRGKDVSDFAALGLTEIFSKDAIVALEWADRIKKGLPKNRIDVFIKAIDESRRTITLVHPRGAHGGILAHPGGVYRDAAKILKAGGVVIFPTDTVYGIGCRYDNKESIDRLYRIKKTPQSQPFPILVSSVNQVRKLAKVPKAAEKLIKKYWPGALTIILFTRHPERERRICLDSSGAPQNDTSKVGFRIPNSKVTLDLIDTVGVPIIGTSANFHGQIAPKSFKELDPKIIKLADFVVKGKCKGRVESTVVDATVDPPKILRQGAVMITQLTN